MTEVRALEAESALLRALADARAERAEVAEALAQGAATLRRLRARLRRLEQAVPALERAARRIGLKIAAQWLREGRGNRPHALAEARQRRRKALDTA